MERLIAWAGQEQNEERRWQVEAGYSGLIFVKLFWYVELLAMVDEVYGESKNLGEAIANALKRFEEEYASE